MTYHYPKVQGGYRWNMLARIREEVGIEVESTGDTQLNEGEATAITFFRDLTAEEKQKLDTLMASSPANPPSPKGSVVVIKDFWECKNEFEKNLGLPFRVYFSESNIGSGNIDRIELHFEKDLSEQDREAVRKAYNMLLED